MNFKNFSVIDIGLTKLAVFCITLFLISVWPAFNEWAVNVHWAWFLVIGIAASIKPVITALKK